MRGRAREVSTEPQIDGREDKVSPDPVVTPLLQDTLLRVLSVLEGFSQGGGRLPHHMTLVLERGLRPKSSNKLQLFKMR